MHRSAAARRRRAAGVAAAQSSARMSTADRAFVSALDSAIDEKIFAVDFTERAHAIFTTATPFAHLSLDSFLAPRVAELLRTELRGLHFREQRTDLYHFHQSGDLKAVTTPLVSLVRDSLYSDKFRAWLQRVTGIEVAELSAEVSMSAAVYGDTHRLLCHDDELQGRRIAYILYLVDEPWTAADGGQLDLFGADHTAEPVPGALHTSLVPRFNSFTFFAVSPVSFHQVREVTTDRPGAGYDPSQPRVRLSISGWFHGANVGRPMAAPESPLSFQPIDDPDPACALSAWVSKDYLKPDTKRRIAQHFEIESSLELCRFLQPERFDLLVDEMTRAMLVAEHWTERGPAIRRRYYELRHDAINTPTCHAFVTFLRSRSFVDYLASISALRCVASRSEVRRFSAGCYTLMRDDDPERAQEALDATFTLIAPHTERRWDAQRCGGSVHYIATGESDSLASIEPRTNTLSLVYRAHVDADGTRDDAETAIASASAGAGGVVSFVEYVTHHAPGARCDFALTFRVEQADEGEGEGTGG